MQKKILLVFAMCCLFAAFSEASLVKGSVPAGGSKLYTFTPDFTGIALFSLIYDNVGSDLDIRLAVRNSSNELVPLAFSESELKNFEELQIGVLGGITYTVLVFSSHGPSPFRMNFDGTFSTSSAGQAGAAAPRIPALREIKPDAAALRFIEETMKHSREFKPRQ